jgi:SAM-dependent methyltransferase
VHNLLQFHQWLLSDRNRTGTYRDAIHQIVKHGHVVLDLGAGSGILSFFACQAGARKVYAVEQSDAIEFARELCAANGLTDRIEFLNDRSQNIILPEPVDTIVTDTGASFGLQGGTLGALLDAKRRFLKPGGKVIPESVDLFVAPVEFNDGRNLDIWSKDRYGLDLSLIRRYAANTNHNNINLQPQSLLAASETLARINFLSADNLFVAGDCASIIERDGVMHGLGAWMTVNLVAGISFSNSPINPTVDWARSFFPIETPTAVRVGDAVKTKISTYDGKEWRWQVEIYDGDPSASKSAAVKARFDQATLGSFPIRAEQLKKQLPDYAPTLSRKGEAEAYVMGAFDGKRTAKEIAEEVAARFADCFPTKTAAAEFVGRIVARCS